MSLPPGTRVGKYVIQRKLAEGGMAEIFLASSFGPEGFEKQVVIKRIRPSFADDAAFVEMFISEARLVSKLNHANIVQIFDFDRHEDTFYIAMEYVRGKSLAQAHQRSRELSIPLAPALAAQIVVEVARGLGFAHRLTEHGQQLGLVHRDVTPQNILLSYEGAVKLTDFGIAKAGTRASTVGMLKGKFAYMSPEQSRGQSVDSRTDIFALGITLWELLSGGRLFDADSDVAVLNAVQERTVPPPEQLNPSVDGALSAIVMRCLERDKAARFQTAHELERGLSRYLSTAAEETDVGAWMHSVFPIESARTESTEFRQERVPIRLEGGTPPALLQEGGATAAQVLSGSAPPPDLLEGTSRREVRNPDVQSGVGWDEPTARTPIIPNASQATSGEPATRPSAQPQSRSRKELFVGLAAGAALAAVALTLLWGPKWKPATAPPAEIAKPPPQEAPTPVVVSPPPEVKPPPAPVPGTPELKKKPVVVRKHASPKSVPARAAAPDVPQVPTVAHQLPLAAQQGTLVLIVSPAGEVLIDGKLQRKQEGRAEYELSPGTHQIEVRGPSNWRKEVVLKPSQKTWEWAYR